MPLHCFSKDSLCWVGIRRFIHGRLSVSIPNFVSLISLQIPFLVKCWRKNCYREKDCSSGCHVRFLGKGEVILASTPCFYELWCWMGRMRLIFSYIVPDGWIPIVRTEGIYKKETAQVQMSPFAISQPLAGIVICRKWFPSCSL